MDTCAHPESLLGWCYRSAPCMGEACEWAAAQCPRQEADHTTSVYDDLQSWNYEKNDPQSETLVSPCGRYQIIRVRVSILGRRYSAWDKYPTDGDGLPTLAGVSDSSKVALRMINGSV